MPRMRRFVIVIAIFLFTTGAFAQLTEAIIDKDVRDTIEAWHVPGLAIAVVQNDKVIFIKGYGIKEAGKTQPVTAGTLFEIGSTTKAFTATAMAMLAVLDGIPPAEAVDYVRARYSPHAVETPWQRRFVQRFRP